jgi:hypothetical protein
MLRRMKEDNLGLGPTETEIMGCLWVHGSLTVKQIHAKINAYRLIAYTTILTTSSRLEEKRLITRHTTGASPDADGYARRAAYAGRSGGLSEPERQCHRSRSRAGRAQQRRWMSKRP